MKKTLLALLAGATVTNAIAQVPLTEVQLDAQTTKAKISIPQNRFVPKIHDTPRLLQSDNVKRLPERFQQAAKARMEKLAYDRVMLMQQHTTAYSTPKNASGTLDEGFEGWDGQTSNWLPEEWTEQISNEEYNQMEEGRFTWHTCDPSSVNPTEGNYCAAIYYAHKPDPDDSTGKKDLDLPQDEWLISPTFTPQEGENLLFDLAYAPLFLFNLSNEYVDFDSFEFIKRQPSTTLQILVRQEGGEWEMLLDIFDEWKDFTFLELYNNYLLSEFRSYNLPLERYTGKSLQVAFRFVGQYGSTMYLDAVRSGKEALHTAYKWPAGSFYWAYNDHFEILHDSQGKSFMLVPPYTDITWTNTSDEGATGFTWQYADPTSPWSYLTTDTKDLTMNYPYAAYAIPMLTSHAEGYADGSYTWDGMSFQAGGTGIYPDSEGNIISYGMSRFDPRIQMQLMTDINDGPLFGHHNKSRNTWTNLFGLTGDEWGELEGVGNKFDKPTAPYVVSMVRMHAMGEVKDNAELTAHVYRTTPEGTLGEELGRGSCKGKDAVKTNGQLLTFAIPIQRVSADGQLLNEPVVVDSEVFVMVGGMADNDQLTNMGVLNTTPSSEEVETGGYAFVLFSIDGQQFMNAYPSYSFNGGNGLLYTDFAITIDATYNWLMADEDLVKMPAEGGTYDLPVNYYLTNWTVEKWNADETEAKWLSYKLSEDKKTLKLTADPLGKDEEKRSCTLTLKGWGASDTLTVEQSNGVVSIAQAENQEEKIWLNGNILHLQNEKAQTAMLHDAYGRLLMQWSLQNGQSVTDLKALPNGIYLIRLDNGTTHKFVK